MSPDIEWRIGEDAEQETIAQITTSRPSRWRKPIVLLVAALGVGLGVLYASIPEPARPIAPPTPIATPRPPTPTLAQTIDREVRALSQGDSQTLISLWDPAEPAWRHEQISALSPWGAPPSHDQLYRILATDQADAQHAWADVLQYRAGKYFRETRFYRWRDGAWVRTRPVSDRSWWGSETTLATRYFQLTHSAADEEPARRLAGYLAHQSRETCRVFGCNFDERPPVVHFSLEPDPPDTPQRRETPGAATVTVTLPSPRVGGYYTKDFSGVDIDPADWDRYFAGYLYFPLLYTAVGGPERWDQKRDGLMYLYAVGLWDLAQRQPSRVDLPDFPFRPELMTGTIALTADEMWRWPQDLTAADVELRLSYASALVRFIDETYGANMVRRFFRTLRFAQSLTHALNRLGVPYDEFEAQWLVWSSQAMTKKPELSN